MTEARPFRLLVTGALDGAQNMALDEALLVGRQRGTSPPTLRLYAWNPPAISLGYGQRLDARIDTAAAARLGIGIVRRPTGGSAILHEASDSELTYSVVAGDGDFAGADDLMGTYRWIGAALCDGLRALGTAAEMVAVQPSDPASMPTFCFARTGSYEIEVDGKKLVGSAQRRQGAAFLQHGAVMIAAHPDRLAQVFPAMAGQDPLRGMTTVAVALGRRPSFDEVADRVADGFRRAHALELAPGDPTADETGHAERLVAEKYGTEGWTRAGRRPARSVA